MPRPNDRTVPAGQVPSYSGFIAQREGSAPETPGLLGQLLVGLRALFQDQPVYAIPVPFKYWVAYEIALVAGNNWIDEMRYLQGRRGFAVVNWNVVATNFVYINSHAMGGVAQGGRLAGAGGSFYAPVGHGQSQQQIHCVPLVAGTIISFYQFS